MKELHLKNITMLALAACCLVQVGAQLFAISVVVSTLTEAPPRSFAMLNGKYGYNSSAFWDIVPMITFLLFIIALITNWKNQRRNLIFFALALFIMAGLLAGFFLEPVFADLIKAGYSDEIDPLLQARAKKWYLLDWTVWLLGLFTGLILLVALMRPVKVPVRNVGNSSA